MVARRLYGGRGRQATCQDVVRLIWQWIGLARFGRQGTARFVLVRQAWQVPVSHG